MMLKIEDTGRMDGSRRKRLAALGWATGPRTLIGLFGLLLAICAGYMLLIGLLSVQVELLKNYSSWALAFLVGVTLENIMLKVYIGLIVLTALVGVPAVVQAWVHILSGDWFVWGPEFARFFALPWRYFLRVVVVLEFYFLVSYFLTLAILF